MKKLRIASESIILLDDDIYNSVPHTGWWINSYGYAVRQKRISNNKRKNIYIHHLVLPKIVGFDIDHINRNKLDNTRLNLRYATRSQNILNMDVKNNNTSGFKGVSWSKQHQKWRAFIYGGKNRKELGLFSNIREAIEARRQAERKMNI